jgi:SAM-dependent methyltransferase
VTGPGSSHELERIRDRYERRRHGAPRYDPLLPWVYMSMQERERAFIRWIDEAGLAPVSNKRLLEIGCGGGQNLVQFLRLGFSPGHLVGNDLIEERASEARRVLPAETAVLPGDASALDLAPASFDVVFQSTVFSSILDRPFRERLAGSLWRLVKPGGGVLWYDFVYDNPRNPDVTGIRTRDVQALFPEGEMRTWRVTLAPPLARAVSRVHPQLYTVLNMLPFLRTHVLCWIRKRSEASG